MDFEYDIYISFAQEDNTVKTGNNGWVDNFRRFLEMILSQLFSRSPSFLFYQTGEKPLASEIEKAGIMIAIISPSYINSQNCLEDIHLFDENVKKHNDINLPFEKRVFKVLKTNVGTQEQPTKIQGLLEYDFFDIDIENNTLIDLEDLFGELTEESYWTHLLDLAYDIYTTLLRIRNQNENEIESNHPNFSKAVYIAETIPQLWTYRNIIKRELQRYGYQVFPDQMLPQNPLEMELAIRKYIEKCRISIHLLGGSYGQNVKGLDISITDLQNKIATEHSSLQLALKEDNPENSFLRMVWLPPLLNEIEERQQLFLEKVKEEIELLESVEVLQIPLEDFKTIIKEELQKKDFIDQLNQYSSEEKKALNLYLLYDKIDEEAVKGILELLNSKNIVVHVPRSQGNLKEVYNSHIENLINCDIVLIYANLVDSQWVQMKILDSMKSLGFGRKNPMKSKFLIYAESMDLDKNKLKSQGVQCLNTIEEIKELEFTDLK